jgi:hypothetical protein
MNSVTCDLTMSLDGFIAGPNQSLANPLGEGGAQDLSVFADNGTRLVTHLSYRVIR